MVKYEGTKNSYVPRETVKRFVDVDAWKQSSVDLKHPALVGYQITGITHRNGVKYDVEQTQFLGNGTTYLRLIADEPFLKGGNGIMLGNSKGGEFASKILIQNPDIKMVYITVTYDRMKLAMHEAINAG